MTEPDWQREAIERAEGPEMPGVGFFVGYAVAATLLVWIWWWWRDDRLMALLPVPVLGILGLSMAWASLQHGRDSLLRRLAWPLPCNRLPTADTFSQAGSWAQGFGYLDRIYYPELRVSPGDQAILVHNPRAWRRPTVVLPWKDIGVIRRRQVRAGYTTEEYAMLLLNDGSEQILTLPWRADFDAAIPDSVGLQEDGS